MSRATGPTGVAINPEKLTPASRRALHKIMAAFLIAILFIAAAFGLVVRATQCVAKQYAWDGVTTAMLLQTQPLSLDGYTGELLVARTESNAQRAINRKAFALKYGPRPEC